MLFLQKEFAQLMSVFSLRAPREQKLRFAYKIYDNDDDGKISREDLKTSLKTVMQDNIDDDFLEEVRASQNPKFATKHSVQIMNYIQPTDDRSPEMTFSLGDALPS